ncbi:MAG: hypothetical protein LC117_05760 [Bacteroidia bacterium]|nr:hypothetical protein [Bacteroidia bacterium]MCZ2277417.1 hypothetical protein [Bacteroidia bacterium]
MKKIILFTFCFLSLKLAAQEITMEYTLEYINSKLGSCCTIDISRGILSAEYRELGEVVREDNVSISDLDLNSIHFDSENRMVVINCKGAPASKCVSREIPAYGKRGIYRPYSRISWQVNLNEKSVQGLERAFAHMIKLVLNPKYSSSEPFE